MGSERQSSQNTERGTRKAPSSGERGRGGVLTSLAPQVRQPRGRRETLILGTATLVVCILVTAGHWPVLSAQALSFDDEEFVTNNRLVCNPSWESVGRFLGEVLEPSTVRGYYLPLSMISLMADYALGGRPDDLRVFHRTSLGLHALNTGLIIILLYSLFGEAIPAALAGLLFGLHPLTVEPIAWVGERKTLLAAFFTLWSLLLYVRHARRGGWGNIAASLLMYSLAMMSKPTAAPLPLLLPLMDLWPLCRFTRRTVIEKAPFFIVGGLFGIVTLISHQRTAGIASSDASHFSTLPLVVSHLIVFYMGKIVWPANLTSVYPLPEPMGWSNPWLLLSLAAACIGVTALILLRRRTPAPLAGWLFFFVAILPTLGLVQYSWVTASDKYAYLPAVGLLMVLTWGLGRIWRFGGPRAALVRTVVVVCVTVLAAAEARGVRSCIVQWGDALTHAQYMVALAPKVPAAQNHLGDALGRRGQLDQAIERFRTALALLPGYVEAYHNLGIALRLRGDIDEAMYYLGLTIKAHPEDADAHCALGLAHLSKGQHEEAHKCFLEALRIRPDLTLAQYGLGLLYQAQNRLDEAAAEFRLVLERLPNNADTHASLAGVLQAQGRIDEAVEHFRRAIQIQPEHADVHGNLGAVLARRGQFDEAISHFQEALSIVPDHVEAYYNWGLALQYKGDLAGAIARYNRALEIKPDSAEAHNGLGIVLVSSGQPKEALEHFQEAARLKPDWVPALNAAAWLMATHSDAAIGSADEAVRLAERAADLSELKNAGVLDTLAAAYASAGQFDKAVATAQKAATLASANGDEALAAEVSQRLTLYRQARSYREPVSSSAPAEP